MKKNILFLCLCILSIQIVRSQSIVTNPEVGLIIGDGNLHIDTVRLERNSTRLYCTVRHQAGHSVNIPKETYIQAVGGASQKLFIQNVVGGTIGSNNIIPTNGNFHYEMVFPAVASTSKRIDFGENIEDGKKIYDIEIIKPSTSQQIPAALTGALYNVANGDLEYAFYKKNAIKDNLVWQYKNIHVTKDKAIIQLERNGKIVSIAATMQADSSWFIAVNNVGGAHYVHDLALCKQDHSRPAIDTLNLRWDTAIISGYIVNYTARSGFTTLEMIVNNYLTGQQEDHVVDIDSSGYFIQKISVANPQDIMIELGFVDEAIMPYVEVGKPLFCLINANNVYYGGKGAVLANEWKYLNNNISELLYDSSQAYIKNNDPAGYKKFIQGHRYKDMKLLDSIGSNPQNVISPFAHQIWKIKIEYDYFTKLLDYTIFREKGAHLSNADTVLPENYYEELTTKIANSTTAPLMGFNYYCFINRLKYAVDKPYSLLASEASIRDVLVANGGSMDALVQHDIASLDAIMKDPTDTITARSAQKLIDKYNSYVFLQKYASFRDSLIKNKLGIDAGFAFDIMNAQDHLKTVVNNNTPFNTEVTFLIKNGIQNPFIKHYIDICNDQALAQIEKNKKSSAFVVNATPTTSSEKLFDAIISKYKGKVVYLDFWATWCGSCLSGIKEIAPLKEELKDSAVSFVYITDESSPLPVWQNTIPTIRGEQYRLTREEWNQLAKIFKISGIPHTVLIDKNGKVVNPDLGWKPNDEIRKMITALF